MTQRRSCSVSQQRSDGVISQAGYNCRGKHSAFQESDNGNSIKRRSSGHRSAGEREERTKRTMQPRGNMAPKYFAQTLHSGGVTIQAEFIGSIVFASVHSCHYRHSDNHHPKVPLPLPKVPHHLPKIAILGICLSR